jgi:hypothetical protein
MHSRELKQGAGFTAAFATLLCTKGVRSGLKIPSYKGLLAIEMQAKQGTCQPPRHLTLRETLESQFYSGLPQIAA